VESHEDEELPVAYNLEEVVEYQELLGKYAALEEQVNQLKNTITQLNDIITSLTTENKSLAEFKMQIDREKKMELINSFYMLSDD
jgi:peptidoglycan hydrolase CwlO-like protein